MRNRTLWPARLASLTMLAGLLTAAAPLLGAGPDVADWTLDTIEGEPVNFHAALARGPVLMSFWATWCKPCLKEMPHLDELAGEYAGRLTVLAVNIDSPRSVAKVRPLLHSKGLEHLIVPLDTGREVHDLLQVGGIVPFVVLYAADGTEVYRHTGYKEGDEVELLHQVKGVLGLEQATPGSEG